MSTLTLNVGKLFGKDARFDRSMLLLVYLHPDHIPFSVDDSTYFLAQLRAN